MICLDPMNPADLAHPLMCSSSQCCYNFCCNCIESLIEQKQATGLTFDDGDDTDEELQSRHHSEDVILHCPNCRSDLGHTICDTILLRKVDQVPTASDSDEEIIKRLALKKAMDADVTILCEIAQAREREARFWEKKFAATRESSDSNADQTEDHPREEQREEECDEWGFEVDIRTGAHESIKLPKEMLPFSVFQTNQIKADRTLLGGLESAIPREDQVQLTRMLVSGDTSELAKAAEILSTVAESVHILRSDSNGGVSVGGGGKATISSTASLPPQPMPRRSSIYNWIEVGKKARSPSSSSRKQNSNAEVPSYHQNYIPYTKSYTIKATKHRQIERQLREKLAFMRRHPLPVRMPKYAEFTIQFDDSPEQLDVSQIVKSLPVRFCNDTWDGTVIDAFSKIYVSHKSLKSTRNGKNYAPTLPKSTFIDNYSVSHKRQETEGIRNILDGGLRPGSSSNRGDVRIDTPHRRVLIAAVVDPSASLQGVLKGDVATHLNGEELRDCSVDDVVALICSLVFSSSTVVVEEEDGEGDGGGNGCSDGGDGTTGAKQPRRTVTTTLKFVLNADRATAEALKMRARAPNY